MGSGPGTSLDRSGGKRRLSLRRARKTACYDEPSSDGVEHVDKESLNGLLGRFVNQLVEQGVPLKQAKAEFERRYLLTVVRRSDGKLTRAAHDLGVHRNTLRNRLAALGVAPDEYQKRPRSRRS